MLRKKRFKRSAGFKCNPKSKEGGSLLLRQYEENQNEEENYNFVNMIKKDLPQKQKTSYRPSYKSKYFIDKSGERNYNV